MQISQNLPQFDDKQTLILVSGTQSADLYIAYGGEIEKITEVRTEADDSDEQPGRFDRRSKGKTLGVGGVAEKGHREKMKERFHGDLAKALKNVTGRDIEQTILLSSPQDKPNTKEQFPYQLKDTIVLEIDGNFVGEHPDEILKRIQEASS